jgi:hypothetical protein
MLAVELEVALRSTGVTRVKIWHSWIYLDQPTSERTLRRAREAIGAPAAEAVVVADGERPFIAVQLVAGGRTRYVAADQDGERVHVLAVLRDRSVLPELAGELLMRRRFIAVAAHRDWNLYATNNRREHEQRSI